MSNESENIDDQMEAHLEIVRNSTLVTFTPETEIEFGIEGTFWLYSQGMKENHDLPDLEIRGVPGMFIETAGKTINEMNAYRLFSERPILVGERVKWDCGIIQVEQGDDWEGAYAWAAEDMLRLTSHLSDVPGCHSCETADIEE